MVLAVDPGVWRCIGECGEMLRQLFFAFFGVVFRALSAVSIVERFMFVLCQVE
jgi:hypothetical protein